MRTAREGLGLTMQAAADGAKISPGYLFKLESGYVGTPSPRVLYRLAPVLGLSYWDLMEHADYVVPGQPAGASGQSGHSLEEKTADLAPPVERVVAVLERMCGELSELRRQQGLLLAALGERLHRTVAADPSEQTGDTTA